MCDCGGVTYGGGEHACVYVSGGWGRRHGYYLAAGASVFLWLRSRVRSSPQLGPSLQGNVCNTRTPGGVFSALAITARARTHTCKHTRSHAAAATMYGIATRCKTAGHRASWKKKEKVSSCTAIMIRWEKGRRGRRASSACMCMRVHACACVCACVCVGEGGARTRPFVADTGSLSSQTQHRGLAMV